MMQELYIFAYGSLYVQCFDLHVARGDAHGAEAGQRSTPAIRDRHVHMDDLCS
jgi:hypothetical protein